MSDTTETITPKPDPLLDAQFLIAIYAMTIVAGAVAGVFLIHDLTPIQAGIASSAVSTPLGAVMGFYFMSAISGKTKDKTIAALAGAPPEQPATTTKGPTP